MTDSKVPYSALLLAGGRSSRMGADKAFLPWLGKPLWRVQVQKLRELKPVRLLVACREEQGLEQTEEPGVEWLFDPPGSDCGPMGPLCQALAEVQGPLVVLAVDMPEMSAAFLAERMLGHSSNRALFFQAAHGVEPLAGIYTPALLPLMETAIARGRFSLRGVIQEAIDQGLASVLPLTPMDALCFRNANTPDEWSAACKSEGA